MLGTFAIHRKINAFNSVSKGSLRDIFFFFRLPIENMQRLFVLIMCLPDSCTADKVSHSGLGCWVVGHTNLLSLRGELDDGKVLYCWL